MPQEESLVEMYLRHGPDDVDANGRPFWECVCGTCWHSAEEVAACDHGGYPLNWPSPLRPQGVQPCPTSS